MSDAPLGAGHLGEPTDRDQAMTRSEEELLVDTVKRPAERVRVRKRIVTEEVTVTVPLRREELTIERVAEGSAVAGTAAVAGDGPLVIELHREEYEVVKRVIPVERVRITKELLVEEHEVSGKIRKEQIEFEAGPGPTA